ncbi:MAG: hypothetical protein FWH23_07515 [Bacteroidales bacterium]|nr:hypothetical protein [Bacteroidales bacterium]
MKIYLKSVVRQLQRFSASLDKTSILIEKPWAMIDEEFEMQKLIFRKNKELVLSKNGQVQMGKWDYFPEAKSLLIDRGADKILCNEAFIDSGVMILRLDGTDNRFFMLANENIVPDLDANKYLKKLRYQRLNIKEKMLVDGKILEIQREEKWQLPKVGNPVTIDAELIEDGMYQLSEREYFEIKKSVIYKILTETKYTNPDGFDIFVQQQDNYAISRGDYVYMFDEQVDNAVINFSKAKNLIVRDGSVDRLEYKNTMLRWVSENLFEVVILGFLLVFFLIIILFVL